MLWLFWETCFELFLCPLCHVIVFLYWRLLLYSLLLVFEEEEVTSTVFERQTMAMVNL